MNVCTIIAKNYLAYARVLASSFARHHPDGHFWTLIIDDFTGRIDPTGEPFEVLSPAEIDCEAFMEMAMRYSVLELSTAVKPWLLRYLIKATGGPVTYLDPDIKIYGSLQRLDDLTAEHGLTLIPHNLDPIPADGRRPNQIDIMIAGVYNLGYVSMAPGPENDRLLDWWSDRLRRDCRVDPVWGYFVDQRWFDLAPGFLNDLAIMRGPQYNVAYWNLHSRRLERADGGYLVNGNPLAFFHFSGFDPQHPLVLSRHQDRIDVTKDLVLEQILAEYARDVMAEGHATSRRWRYTYGSLPDGMMLDETARSLWDVFASERERNHGVPSPFTKEGAQIFAEWLAEQQPGGPVGINRVLAHVYYDRADLRGAYPDPGGADRHLLLRWAEEFGRDEIPLLGRLGTGASLAAPEAPGEVSPSVPVSSAPAPPSPATPPSAYGDRADSPLQADRWGVNVVGYFRSELGMGEAARQVVRALDAASVKNVPIHGQTIPLNRQGYAYVTAAPEDAVFPVNLICMNADALPEFTDQVGDEFFAGRYSIGLWFWEVSTFPERWRDSFSLLEEVWAPTAHVKAALEPLATVPVNLVRIPVRPPALEPRSRADLGLADDEYVFLFSFDYLSVFERKNPLAVVEAFRRSFKPGDGARLVLKCINHERDPDAHARLLVAAAKHPAITVMDRYLTPGENRSLTALCDCYVSLHRAEGFGLGMAEAMCLAKPVIATGYAGNLDFMTPTNSLLVDHRMVPIGPDAPPYPADGEWAEPDVEHAATLMRRLFDDPHAGRRLGEVAAREIRETHSPEAAGRIMSRRLEAIRGTGRARPLDRTRNRPPALAALPLRVGQGPAAVQAQGASRKPREFLRKVVLRLIRPFTLYQTAVNKEILAALNQVNDHALQIRDDAAAERARLIGELGTVQALLTQVEAQARRIEELERRLAR